MVHHVLQLIAIALLLVASATNAFTPISVSSSRTTRRTTQRNNLVNVAAPLFGSVSSSTMSRDTIVMMPATIEKEKVRKAGGASPVTIERPTTERRKHQADEPVKDRKENGSQGWEVRIYNDGINTREYVARSLVQITGMSEMSAYQTMMQAHQNGLAVVGRWVYEVAEMYHDALRKSGIVCDLVPVDEDN